MEIKIAWSLNGTIEEIGSYYSDGKTNVNYHIGTKKTKEKKVCLKNGLRLLPVKKGAKSWQYFEEMRQRAKEARLLDANEIVCGEIWATGPSEAGRFYNGGETSGSKTQKLRYWSNSRQEWVKRENAEKEYGLSLVERGDKKNNVVNLGKKAQSDNEENSENEELFENPEKPKFPLNQILYGPPGTGKTYNSVIYAVAILGGIDIGDDYKLDIYTIKELQKKCVDRAEYEKVLKRYNKLKKDGYIEFITFHQSYGYEEFIQGIKPIVIGEDDERKVIYKVEDGIFKKFCDEAKKEENKDKKYVFIIDEINRGNVSKIFGELITLIEESKRISTSNPNQGMTVKLPYKDENGKDEFGVPDNVYILGTMNTADRSLVQLDAALRRRFRFEEMMPRADLLNEVDGVNLAELLNAINERICALIDREHQIGHSYFMKVKTIDDLRDTFQYEIIPLLQEYFYDDYENILQVLNNQLIKVDSKKFGNVDYKTYTINAKDAKADEFKAIYGVANSKTKNEETENE